MEPISNIALRPSESMAAQRHSSKHLNAADGELLTEMLTQMVQRYPHQDLSESMEIYLHDYERLAVRFGIHRLMTVLSEFRIQPGQRFFPQPDEVCEALEALVAKEKAETRKRHPYRPCGQCLNGQVVVNEDGTPWDWQRDRLRTRFTKQCQCLIAWRAEVEEGAK